MSAAVKPVLKGEIEMGASVTAVSEDNYEQEVAKSGVPVLIDFWAPWCGPCMALMPAIEAIAPIYEGSLKVVKINSDENPGLAQKFGVQGIPQLFLVKDGQTVASLRERTRTRLTVELDKLLT